MQNAVLTHVVGEHALLLHVSRGQDYAVLNRTCLTADEFVFVQAQCDARYAKKEIASRLATHAKGSAFCLCAGLTVWPATVAWAWRSLCVDLFLQ